MDTPSSHPLTLADFTELYRESPDPWKLSTDPNEVRRVERAMSLLSSSRYDSALELGCGGGHMTGLVAQRASRVVGVDCVDAALRVAGDRCASLLHVRFEKHWLPDSLPKGTFDLVVLSEIAYYMHEEVLRRFLQLVSDRLRVGGELLLAHASAFYSGQAMGGEQVSAVADSLLPELGLLRQHASTQGDVSFRVFRRGTAGVEEWVEG